jgi:hypothetical protein
MDSSKEPGLNLPVIGYGGSHRGDEIRHANCLLWIEMSLIVSVFSRLCLLNHSVNLRRTQATVPVGSFHVFFCFFSVKPLPALARPKTLSRTLAILGLVGDSGLLTLAPQTYSYFFYLEKELRK